MEAKELLHKIRTERDWYNYTDTALELCREHDAETGAFNIVEDDIIDEIVKREAEEGGWARVACFLAGAESLKAPYGYHINGYGNLQETTKNDLENWLEEIAEDDND